MISTQKAEEIAKKIYDQFPTPKFLMSDEKFREIAINYIAKAWETFSEEQIIEARRFEGEYLEEHKLYVELKNKTMELVAKQDQLDAAIKEAFEKLDQARAEGIREGKELGYKEATEESLIRGQETKLFNLYKTALKTNEEQAENCVELRKEIEILKSANEFLSKKISHPCFIEGQESMKERAVKVSEEKYNGEGLYSASVFQEIADDIRTLPILPQSEENK